MADMITDTSMGEEGLECVTGDPWNGVRYFCTTRQGGVSTGPRASLNLGRHVGDDALLVDENRRRLARRLPAAPLWLDQVHGTKVFDADAARGESGDAVGLPRADAAVTTSAGRVLAIMTADCLPVVIADLDGAALGVAHAGWRGLVGGVLENTLHSLRARHPRAAGWRAWIGPGISQPHFEVGGEVREAFVVQDPDSAVFFIAGVRPGKWQADLPGLARARLLKAGVQQVQASGHCTYARSDMFYSYRRDPDGGRMATLAWLGPAGAHHGSRV